MYCLHETEICNHMILVIDWKIANFVWYAHTRVRTFYLFLRYLWKVLMRIRAINNVPIFQSIFLRGVAELNNLPTNIRPWPRSISFRNDLCKYLQKFRMIFVLIYSFFSMATIWYNVKPKCIFIFVNWD